MNLEQVFILDSFAMMAYLGAEPGGERINDILKKAAATEIRLYLCMTNFGEILYVIERRRGLEKA